MGASWVLEDWDNAEPMFINLYLEHIEKNGPQNSFYKTLTSGQSRKLVKVKHCN